MLIKFITRSPYKIKEINDALVNINLEQVDFDLDEIQSLDGHEIIKHKLNQALQKIANQENFDGIIVEDTSLYLSCFNNRLPGPLIRWFLEALQPHGISDLVKNMGDNRASATTLIGFAGKKGSIKFFSGKQDGSIVES